MSKIFPWLRSSNSKDNQYAIGLTYAENYFILCFLEKSKNGITISDLIFKEFGEVSQGISELSLVIQYLNAFNLKANQVLDYTQYTIGMIELNGMRDTIEDKQALQKLAADFVDYPISEAIIDMFKIPYNRMPDNKEIGYLVVCNKEIVEKTRILIEATDIKINSIDIPEMSIRNLVVNNFPDKGYLVVQLSNNNAKFVLINQKDVCFVRTIPIDLTHLQHEGFTNQTGDDLKSTLEMLSLEIQRMQDYVYGLFRNNLVDEIIILPSILENNSIVTYLSNDLNKPVHDFDLTKYFTFSKKIDEKIMLKSVLAIGASLREWGE